MAKTVIVTFMVADYKLGMAHAQCSIVKPIVFIGLMGAGKSRIGLELARALNRPFIDADQEIERAAGCTISEIFDRFGEASFRDGERRVIKRILQEEGACVLATGGGAVMNPDTAELIHHASLCIWLDTDMDVLVERTSRNDKRPLLAGGNARQILQDLYQQRKPVYDKTAHIRITGGETPVERITNEILERVSQWQKH